MSTWHPSRRKLGRDLRLSQSPRFRDPRDARKLAWRVVFRKRSEALSEGDLPRSVSRLQTNVAFAAVVIVSLLVSVAVLLGYLSTAPSASTIRLGYFPNVTHAQALFGVSTGLYQRAFGVEFSIQTRAFSAGPTAIEALLSNSVDLVFVGPSPTLNGLAVTGPDVLRIIAGCASGGALFVVQPDLNLTTDADFSGRKFATPQAGNTQDIALKHYLTTRGHSTLDRGGDVDVINAPNPDILSLFQLRQIDGAWVPEPWATRLVRDANGKVFLDERTLWPNGRFVTTHLVTTKRYLEGHRDVIVKFLDAQVNVTLHLQQANSSDLLAINKAIENVTGNRLADATIAAAFLNLNVTYDPIGTSLATYLTWAQELGFIPAGVSASSLYDLTVLNEILSRRGLPPVMGL